MNVLNITYVLNFICLVNTVYEKNNETCLRLGLVGFDSDLRCNNGWLVGLCGVDEIN